MRRIAAILGALCVGGCIASSGAAAQPLACSYAGGYPGDAAAKPELAAWMAAGAVGSGLPAELPVIGALAESELTNLPAAGADSAGYFQMKQSIWDKGPYEGFAGNPPLQLKWFVDQAIAVNQSRIGDGVTPFGDDSGQWGEWAADVLQPSQEYRGRYQLRLTDARNLIAAGCGIADAIPPVLSLAGRQVQDPVRRRTIVVVAACPAEACVASARGRIALPGAAKVFRFGSRARHVAGGSRAKLRLRLSRKLRRALAAVLAGRRRVRARVTVTAADLAGNVAQANRSVALRH